MLSRQHFFVFLRTNQDISKAMGWPKLGLWIFGRIFCACHSGATLSFDLRMKNVVNQSKKTCSAIPKPLNSLNYRLFNRFLFLRDDAVRREIYPEILSARSIPIHSHTHRSKVLRKLIFHSSNFLPPTQQREEKKVEESTSEMLKNWVRNWRAKKKLARISKVYEQSWHSGE